MKKKIIILVISLVSIFLLLGLFHLGRIILNLDYTQKVVFENDTYKIVIKGNGPTFPFGGEDLKIYAKNGFKTLKYKTSVSNDGKNIDDDNFSVDWKEDGAILTIRAEEQKNEYLDINFKTNKIKHYKMEYYVEENDDKSPIVKPFMYSADSTVESEYEYVSYGISIKDKHGQELIPYNAYEFMITLDYEVEEGTATKKWHHEGNAYVYKNDKFTFVECNNVRDNKDYENVNSNYKKYITGDSTLEYKYDMCKPNK